MAKRKKQKIPNKTGDLDLIQSTFCMWAGGQTMEDLGVDHKQDITGRVRSIMTKALDLGYNIMIRRHGDADDGTLSQVMFIDTRGFTQR